MINFGAIRGRRCVSFRVTEDGKVVSAKYRKWLDDGIVAFAELEQMGMTITARESFRRWKAARKAWQKRRGGKQLTLPL